MAIFCNKCGSPNPQEASFCNKCGSPLVKPETGGTLKNGIILDGRYEIIELVKAGGMGAVYRAIDQRLEESCALKEMFSIHTDPKEQEYAVTRFHQEAKILAKLRHMNLPRVIDHFTESGKYYLVMDFIEGEDLEVIMAKEGKEGLAEDKVVKYAIQVLDVLSYLHSRNPPIVYRDIKPPNIIVQKEDDKITLVDFGIARVVQPGSMTKKTSVGTEGYIAPEQYVGKPEPRSDIYGLGATMHHLLTGKVPLIPFHFTPVKEFKPSVSLELNNIVMKALGMKPDDRYSSADEMKQALEKKGQGISLTQESPLPPQAITRLSIVSREEGQYRSLPDQSRQFRTLPGQGENQFRSLPGQGGEHQMGAVSRQQREPEYRSLPKESTGVPEGMVLIPEGPAILGSDSCGDPSCRPEHEVKLKAFYIDIYPVSNLMYRKFIRETRQKEPFLEGKENEDYNWDNRSYPSGKANSPAVLVSWYSASAFAKWSGKRLPTEAEWEKAARGGDGRIYPWGNIWETGRANCKLGGIGSTSAREQFPNDKSPYGVTDMAGNVREWTGDYYFPYPYRGPYKKGKMITIRGGSWSDNPNLLPCYLRSRNLPHYRANNLGFRCVMDV